LGDYGMTSLLYSARALLLDMAATVLFLLLYWLTGSLVVSVGAGMALALAQIGWLLARRRPIDTMQWISLFIVAASGTATLVSRNPVYTMLQPTVVYCLVGAAMLKRGWMNRYLPAVALEKVPDLAIAFGYVWAGLMFFSAALNLAVALNTSVVLWGTVMSIYATASKLALFFIQYGIMRFVGVRRHRRRRPHGEVTAA
jgi:intracellular septation protein A